ncbi:hypothetical protein [Massilia scottii]|uniref:hypothetical protein n=1 Tax=Massilia scottii TaxID=3057166 RepID=UPI002796BEE1|nr:hypothetical protein [Massilia sp. CCM 9029]MDQ1831953.1 hypothetical protein [Massilia sp. CCM 9029]
MRPHECEEIRLGIELSPHAGAAYGIVVARNKHDRQRQLAFEPAKEPICSWRRQPAPIY